MTEKDRTIGFMIAMIHRTTFTKGFKNLQNFGIGCGQLPILKSLTGHNGVSQDSIAKDLQLNKATIARSIKKLEDAGFVERKSVATDKRIKEVFLTELAIQHREEFKKTANQYTDKLLTGFNEKERQTLAGFLKRMITNIEKNK